MDQDHDEIKLHGGLSIPVERFYSLVIGSLHDYSIFTTDRNLMINCWCAGSIKIFGFQPEEAIGKHIGLIFTEEDKANGVPQQEMVTALKEGKASDNRWHQTSSGSLFYAYGLMYPINDDSGDLIGFVKILRDLTERKMAEDALRKKMRELEELNDHKENILAILSHDLRSPLGSIIEITDYLKNSIDDMGPGEVRQMLDILYQSSTDELNMLDYLLEWARIKYASDAFSPYLTNLHQTVSRVFEMLHEMAQTNSIRMINKVNEQLQVYADKKMLNSILQNLVSNAIKFTPAGGTITVSATGDEDKVTVKVQDTGMGMTQYQMDKLFLPRLKTLAQARKEDKGAGIGLLLVKGFLEKNNGEIWVESTPGQGTSFYFTLPSRESSTDPVNAEITLDQEG